MIEFVMQNCSVHSSDSDVSAKQSRSAEAAAAPITEFIYDPESGANFYAWCKRWEDIFRVEFAKADDAWKLDTFSDISLISKRTWQKIGRPPMITSDKKTMYVSGGFLRLTGELECDPSFDGTQFN
ncbi:unnamed protein product [Dibothriocephalus latus]|uniref:Uncharacterized protein n=1 Tax=Dibothriocephalus latus TaxID=60516 RepID=A0A3P7LS99_DIBLA|nr:unnamed protein product [Dibothriocephalus latus]